MMSFIFSESEIRTMTLNLKNTGSYNVMYDGPMGIYKVSLLNSLSLQLKLELDLG